MSTKKRANVKPGGRIPYKPYKRSHTKGAGKRVYTSVRQEDMAEVTEYRVMMSGHESHFWAPRIDEIDAYGPVRVYDAEGRLVRTVAKVDVTRPMPTRNKLSWNDRLFGRVTDDKV